MVSIESTDPARDPCPSGIFDRVAEHAGQPAPSAHAVAVDRRRPGRPAVVSQHLLPLLRGAATADLPPQRLLVEADDLPEPLLGGIVSATLISSIIWAITGTVGWALLH